MFLMLIVKELGKKACATAIISERGGNSSEARDQKQCAPSHSWAHP